MRWCFSVFLVLLGLQASIAQSSVFREGSVKLKSGRELKGYIGKLMPGNPEQIEFKVHQDSAVQLYNAGEVEGYSQYSIFYSSYVTKLSPPTWTFAEIVVDGELSLIYRNGMPFLRRRNSDEFIHLTGGYRRTFADVMENCPYVAAKSMSVGLNKQEMGEHVRAYNECIATKDPNLDGIPRTLSIGLMAGYDYTQTSFVGEISGPNTRFLSAAKQQDKSFVQFGIDVMVKPYKVSNFLGLYFGAFYNKNLFSTTNSVLFASQVEVNTYTIEYSEMKFPIGIELSKPWRKKVSMNFRAGVVVPKTIHLSSSHPSYEAISILNNEVTYLEPSRLARFKSKLLVSGAVGADYHLEGAKRIRLQLIGNFGKVEAIAVSTFDETPITGKLLSFNVMGGYVF